MSEITEVQAKPWQLLWQPLPDEGAEYQRAAIAEAQATRPDEEQPEEL
jgi:hypothetical protein